MAKTTSKPAAKVAKKAPAPAAKPTAKAKTKAPSIDKVCAEALKKLKALDIEHQLQADIEWCLGSYSYDKNPTGLYQMASKALTVFKAELAKKTKGVTAKLVTDLEKATDSQ